jgi:hypothetical protein
VCRFAESSRRSARRRFAYPIADYSNMHLFHAHADGISFRVISRHYFASFRNRSHLFHAHADGISFRNISRHFATGRTCSTRTRTESPFDPFRSRSRDLFHVHADGIIITWARNRTNRTPKKKKSENQK